MKDLPAPSPTGNLRLPRLDNFNATKTYGEATLAFHVQGPRVGVRIGSKCVLLDHEAREEFARIWFEAVRQADACEAPEGGAA